MTTQIESTSDRKHLVNAASITIQNVSKTYSEGTVVALDKCSAEIQPSEFVCLLGPSGCGKSTLLWGVGGLRKMTTGQIKIGNKLVNGPDPRTAMVFQNATLMPWKNLIGNLRLPFEIRGVPKSDYLPRIEWLLDAVGPSGFESSYPRELSGGMQQRASIIRALALSPEVLLMDEPFSALDAFTRDDLSLLLQKMWMQTKATTLFVTHNIPEAIFLADRIFLMSARPGRISAEFEIPFERPRTLDIITSPEFGALQRQIRQAVDSQHKPSGGLA